ncbi:glycosyltransferase family 4 protein [Halobacteriaceae archaeon SHR40]|uniref:glycosyltransferase family 4 protein n=1 Tax=Halovenus amylolytica TaxID=2500550 RepID=UPI000FE31DA8
MRVSVVTPDLSHNCLGRAYVLAKLLDRNHQVEIVGPKLKNQIWEPIRHEYDYKGVETGHRLYHFVPSIPELLNLITGDAVYASKPRTTSYGLSLLATLREDRPLILDVDDWETGFNKKGESRMMYLTQIPRLINANSFYHKRGFEALSRIADARTVSNRFLQNRFGGTIIPHARDTEKFDPTLFNREQVRDEFDLPSDKYLIMFSGTPRTYKGVDNLVRAVTQISRDDVKAVVVGADESEYIDKVRRVGHDSVIIRGMQPFEDIPKWIAAADVIAIPQKDSPATRGQLPAKVFDAMAMGKPIIATNVSDIPIVLENCGRIVKPDNTDQLREAIVELIEDDQLREELGQKARQRCVEKYSYDALAPVLDQVVSEVCNKY